MFGVDAAAAPSAGSRVPCAAPPVSASRALGDRVVDERADALERLPR